MEIRFGNLFFTSKFDSGNLAKVEKVQVTEESDPSSDSRSEFKVWTKADCENTCFENGNRSWFHFGIRGGTPGRLIRINIMNLNRQGKLYSQGHSPICKVVPGRPRWERIRDRPTYKTVDMNFVLSFSFRFLEFRGSTTYFAFCYPWSYAESQNRLASLDDEYQHKFSPITSTPCEDIYYHREMVCRSLDGLRVDLITISSHHGISDQREPCFDDKLFPNLEPNRCHSFTGKRVYMLTSRVHPGETPASFVFNGFLNFILRSDDARASMLRQRFVFKMIPMLNPDGVCNGHYRTDTRGVNLNRVYLDPSFELHPSIYASKAVLTYHHVHNRCQPISNGSGALAPASKKIEPTTKTRQNTNANNRKNLQAKEMNDVDLVEMRRKDCKSVNSGLACCPQSTTVCSTEHTAEMSCNAAKQRLRENQEEENEDGGDVGGSYDDFARGRGHGEVKARSSVCDAPHSASVNSRRSAGGAVVGGERSSVTAARPVRRFNGVPRTTCLDTNARSSIGGGGGGAVGLVQGIVNEYTGGATHGGRTNNGDDSVPFYGSTINDYNEEKAEFSDNDEVTSIGNEGSDDDVSYAFDLSLTSSGSPHLSNPKFRDILPSESGIAFYVDLHGHASKRGCFIYGNYFEAEDLQVQNMLYPRLIALNSAHFDFAACNFTERNMTSKDRRDGVSKEGAGRVAIYKAIGIIHSYTLECNYNMGRLVNCVPPACSDGGRATPPPMASFPPKYTIAHFEDVGKCLGIAALDMFEMNPWSRVSMSEHCSLSGVRDWVRRYLRGLRGLPRGPSNRNQKAIYNNNNNANGGGTNNGPFVPRVAFLSTNHRGSNASISSNNSTAPANANTASATATAANDRSCNTVNKSRIANGRQIANKPPPGKPAMKSQGQGQVKELTPIKSSERFQRSRRNNGIASMNTHATNTSSVNTKSRSMNMDNAKFIKNNAKGRVQLIPLQTSTLNNPDNPIPIQNDAVTKESKGVVEIKSALGFCSLSPRISEGNGYSLKRQGSLPSNLALDHITHREPAPDDATVCAHIQLTKSNDQVKRRAFRSSTLTKKRSISYSPKSKIKNMKNVLSAASLNNNNNNNNNSSSGDGGGGGGAGSDGINNINGDDLEKRFKGRARRRLSTLARNKEIASADPAATPICSPPRRVARTERQSVGRESQKFRDKKNKIKSMRKKVVKDATLSELSPGSSSKFCSDAMQRRKSLPPLSFTYDTTQFMDRLHGTEVDPDKLKIDSLHIGPNYNDSDCELSRREAKLADCNPQFTGFQGFAKDKSPILKDTPAFWVQI